MNGSQFQERLERELRDRRAKNTRYSLRAFATFLETDHSTLSQILRGKRPLPVAQMRRWAKKLGMSTEETAAYIAAEHLPDTSTLKRQQQLRHWTAEALAVINDRSHWEIVRLSRLRGNHADSKSIAQELGISVDRVNMALTRLLRLRLLELAPGGKWKHLLGSTQVTETAFRKRALIRIREFAAADGVSLGRVIPKPTT